MASAMTTPAADLQVNKGAALTVVGTTNGATDTVTVTVTKPNKKKLTVTLTASGSAFTTVGTVALTYDEEGLWTIAQDDGTNAISREVRVWQN